MAEEQLRLSTVDVMEHHLIAEIPLALRHGKFRLDSARHRTEIRVKNFGCAIKGAPKISCERVVLREDLRATGSIAIALVGGVKIEVAQVGFGLREVGNPSTLDYGSRVAEDLETMAAEQMTNGVEKLHSRRLDQVGSEDEVPCRNRLPRRVFTSVDVSFGVLETRFDFPRQ